jgi:hypothetical protein
MFTRSFKTVEDALVQFVRHGKLDFGSLADSIIEDLIRIQIKELELAMFKNMLKMFGGGGGMSMADSLGAGGFMNNSVGETLSFAGGGYTGTGPRSGGVDGMGGFMAIVHPNETVIDHAKGQRLNSAMAGNKTVINHSVINNIDSSTDRAQIDSLVRNAVMQGNVQLVDRLQRQGAL